MQIITNQFQKELKKHGNDSFPFLVSRERLSGYEQGSFLWHWHTEIELTLITSGEMDYQINDRRYHLCRGQGPFCNSSVLHSGSMYQEQDCTYTAVTFDPRLIYGSENSALYFNYVMPVLQNFSMPAVFFDLTSDWHTDAVNLIEQLALLDRETGGTRELDIQCALNRFWKLLYLHSRSEAPVSGRDRRDYERIREILTYIEIHYASPLTLEEIAKHIHLCRSECSRLFKRYMKTSLFDFILKYRIEKSLGFLGEGQYSVKETAERCGFGDSNYYAKVFRRFKGCSPMAYRKSLNKENRMENL